MYNLTQPLHTASNCTPHMIATVCEDRTVTWEGLRERTAKLAGAIRSLGIDEGDNVAILALNSDRYFEFYFGALWAGAVIVPMNTRWSATENAYSLNDSGTSVLFIDAAFVPMVEDIKSETNDELTFIYVDDGDVPEGMLAYEEFLQGGEPVEDARRGGSDLAGIYYTGGTTGFPKGVMLSHQALWYNGMAGAKHFDVQPGDRYLHVAPMFHLADTAGSLGATMSGASHYFMASFTPDGAIDRIADDSITHTLLVPTMISMMLQHPAFEPPKFTNLKTLMYGASPMPEGVLLQVMEQLPNVGLIQGYGQTEMAPLVTVLPSTYHVTNGPNAGKLRSAGRPIVGCEVEIRNEEGDKLPAGEVGEVYARSPGSMMGYLNLPDQTVETLCEGWVKTGDGAYMDEDGFVFIVDRVKDMIVTGGENVFSAEVESVVSTHPAVAAVAVIGTPSEKWGEAVHAVVVTVPGTEVTEQEIIDHCQGKIANYKCPKSITLREDPLPLSGAGKVLKRELRAPFWEGAGRHVS
jgi:acyl-CoA synthetase (AMP-forming)/AMP-acid ligase II